MTSRKIINLTSRKKKDNMLVYTNSTAANQTGNTTYLSAPAVVTGGVSSSDAASFLWCATARNASTAVNGTGGTSLFTATRSASTCYMVGLKENIEIQTNTGMPWQWRRVVFTAKAINLRLPTSNDFSVAAQSSNGWQRIMNQMGGGPGGGGNGIKYALMDILFRGQVNSDWYDPMTAVVDTARVTVKYDKTISIAANNEEGCIRKYRRWHAFGSNLVYDDDEVGGGISTNQFSTTGKAGMGDCYVLDMFRARAGSSNSDQLIVTPEATLYWHER